MKYSNMKHNYNFMRLEWSEDQSNFHLCNDPECKKEGWDVIMNKIPMDVAIDFIEHMEPLIFVEVEVPIPTVFGSASILEHVTKKFTVQDVQNELFKCLSNPYW